MNGGGLLYALLGGCWALAVTEALWEAWRKRKDPYRSVNP